MVGRPIIKVDENVNYVVVSRDRLRNKACPLDAARTPFNLHDFAIACFVYLREMGKSRPCAKTAKSGITEHGLVNSMVQERVATLARIDFNPAAKRSSKNVVGGIIGFSCRATVGTRQNRLRHASAIAQILD
jgi:hypothetical protein